MHDGRENSLTLTGECTLPLPLPLHCSPQGQRYSLVRGIHVPVRVRERAMHEKKNTQSAVGIHCCVQDSSQNIWKRKRVFFAPVSPSPPKHSSLDSEIGFFYSNNL